MKHLYSKEKVVYVLIILILFLALSGFLIEKKAAFAQLDLEKLKSTAGEAGLGTQTDIATIVGKIIKVVFSLVGIILVVLMIAGGFMWMTSAGNAEKVDKAKKLMSSVLIGLIIIILAYSISYFIIGKLSGVTTGTPGSSEPIPDESGIPELPPWEDPSPLPMG